MGRIAAHLSLNARVIDSDGDSVAIGHSVGTESPPPPFSPSLISLMISVDLKHHVHLLCVSSLVSDSVNELVRPGRVPRLSFANTICDRIGDGRPTHNQ